MPQGVGREAGGGVSVTLPDDQSFHEEIQLILFRTHFWQCLKGRAGGDGGCELWVVAYRDLRLRLGERWNHPSPLQPLVEGLGHWAFQIPGLHTPPQMRHGLGPCTEKTR